MTEDRVTRFERSTDGTVEFTQLIETGHYSNEQIRIKFTDDNILSVWVEDDKYPFSQICLRRFQLPQGVDVANLKTFYTNDKKLVIRGPVIAPPPEGTLTSPFLHRHLDRTLPLETPFLKTSLSRLHSQPASSDVSFSAKHFQEILHLNPKFRPENLRISVDKGMICVEAEHQGEMMDYPTLGGMETPSVEKYKKRFPIPEVYDVDKLSAKFNNGTLYIVAPIKHDPNSDCERPIKSATCESVPGKHLPTSTSPELTSATTFKEMIVLDGLFTPENIEISFHGSQVLIRGRASRVDPSTGQTHATHIYRHEIHIPQTVDTAYLAARWNGPNTILVEAPLKNSLGTIFSQHPLLSSLSLIPTDVESHISSSTITGSVPSLLGMEEHQNLTLPCTTLNSPLRECQLDVNGTEKFRTKLRMDPALKPNEFHINVNSSNVVLIEGKMESRDDSRGQHVSKTIKKQHTLPKNVDGEALKASWLEDGFLLLEAPYKQPIQEAERLSSPLQPIVVHRK